VPHFSPLLREVGFPNADNVQGSGFLFIDAIVIPFSESL